MKIEIGKDFPQYFKPAYLEEFDLFSHFERPGKRTGNRMCAFIRGAVFTEIRPLSLP